MGSPFVEHDRDSGWRVEKGNAALLDCSEHMAKPCMIFFEKSDLSECQGHVWITATQRDERTGNPFVLARRIDPNQINVKAAQRCGIVQQLLVGKTRRR